MCGIAGFVALEGSDACVAGLARALDRMAHRGPDDHGTVLVPAGPGRGPLAGLGNRRLSIIDTSPSGHQPMTTADGRYSITYNGEIYNYRELRSQLAAGGHRFASHCDTEVLLLAWAAWGPACLARLEGMFAFAIVDRIDRRMVLARDAFGIKPLFYSRSGGRLVFASEIRGVFEFGGVGRVVNAARLRDYLIESHTGQGPETLLADIRQVPPAHYLEVPLDLSRDDWPTRYWSPDDGARRHVTFAAAAEELRALVLDSVRLHLRSDVPVGFSLSGGLDSSSVLLAARHALGPHAELLAFGFVTDEAAINEAAWQAQAAVAAGAKLHPIRFSATDLGRDLDSIVDIQGEPFGSPTIYAQYRVFARARDAGVKVILGGQGSDELFAGYDTYLPARAATLLMRWRWVAAARFVDAASTRWGHGRRPMARSAVAMALPASIERTLRRVLRPARRARAPDWLDHHWLAARGVEPAPPWRPHGGEAMKQLLVEGIENNHLQALMRYEDRSAMALSLESRVPLLTPRLARFALSLPESHLISPTGEHKAVLREAMRGIVPAGVLDRRDKIGFAVPVARWLVELAPFVEQKLALAGTCPPIQRAEVERRWTAVRQVGHVGAAYTLWRCITLATWAERGAVQWS